MLKPSNNPHHPKQAREPLIIEHDTGKVYTKREIEEEIKNELRRILFGKTKN